MADNHHTQYVVAVDQGTTSTRCILFDRRGRLVSVAQREHRQFFPRPGWVEHDAAEIWRNVTRVVPAALAQGRCGAEPDRRDRDHQPARDQRAVGPPDRRSRSGTR